MPFAKAAENLIIPLARASRTVAPCHFETGPDSKPFLMHLSAHFMLRSALMMCHTVPGFQADCIVYGYKFVNLSISTVLTFLLPCLAFARFGWLLVLAPWPISH
ncbi:expressed unknown protein [Seminavis robusta]|uniref:Uncharacterized protein n=1 Tax=Seminavis robusta TaxID=568900 RepID=A0A9N8EPH4_9STRA|nr:expressed unknown protein [Seminavis robusta]|eukprot:Sro1451_g273863.1  (104) ;mRNA; r:23463-23774